MSSDEGTSGTNPPVEAVDRALRTLDAVAAAGVGGASLAELSAALGVHKTTLHRSLAALRHRSYVAQDPVSGRYALGPGAVRLAEQYFAEDDLPARLHGLLVALCAATDELVHLGVLSGAQIVYLDKVEPERPVRVWSAVGRRNWAATTALGRAMLAFGDTPAAALDGYARAVEPERRIETPRLAATLEQARTRGYAVEVEENEPGIACLALPVMRGSRPVAAISITAPVERMHPEQMQRLHLEARQVLTEMLPPGLAVPATR